MINPEELVYSKDHMWVQKSSNSTAIVGITEFIMNRVRPIERFEMYQKDWIFNDEVKQFLWIGRLLGSGGTVHINTPVSGSIEEVNSSIIVEDDPYKFWLFKISLIDPSELYRLMDYERYSRSL